MIRRAGANTSEALGVERLRDSRCMVLVRSAGGRGSGEARGACCLGLPSCTRRDNDLVIPAVTDRCSEAAGGGDGGMLAPPAGGAEEDITSRAVVC